MEQKRISQRINNVPKSIEIENLTGNDMNLDSLALSISPIGVASFFTATSIR